jgi:PTH1 family peptidyl-tRNA hydrolase
MAVEAFAEKSRIAAWKEDVRSRATIARGVVSETAIVCVLPDTYMNKSGNAVSQFVKSVKAAERCVVVYDDLDLPLGSAKMSFDRGSGGHKGVESIARALKTKAFWRIRVGISPSTASGKLRKPKGEEEVLEFILKKFKPSELAELKTMFKKTSGALETILSDGPLQAMNAFNTA